MIDLVGYCFIGVLIGVLVAGIVRALPYFLTTSMREGAVARPSLIQWTHQREQIQLRRPLLPEFPPNASPSFKQLTGSWSVGMDINPWFNQSMQEVGSEIEEARKFYLEEFGGDLILTT